MNSKLYAARYRTGWDEQGARDAAQFRANESGFSYVVYESLVHPGSFNFALSLPMHAKAIGDRVYPAGWDGESARRPIGGTFGS